MKISAKAEYACLALLALARHGPEAPPLRIREISETYDIPERYLVQILLRLKSAGLVMSTRGAAGGYHLARAASSISVGQILAAIDGPDVDVPRAPVHPSPRRRRARPDLGERPRRRTRRPGPHHHRPARRAGLAPRVDHLEK